MPKGDRLKLKADPEDGTTPIANLLLEAVAMAKLSGLQKGAILYLWRQTYGWVEGEGRRKERQIGLTEWVKALDAIKSSVATALSELEKRNVIFRRLDSNWGSYFYSVNTDISTWNSNCLNLDRLAKSVQLPKTVQFFEAVQSEKREQCDPAERTVTQNRTLQLPKTVPPTLYKERLNKDKEIYNNNIGKIFKIFEENFGQRITETVRETLGDFIDNYGWEKVLVAMNKAIKQNKRSLAYVEGILKEVGVKKNYSKTDPDKFIKGRYGHIVRR